MVVSLYDLCIASTALGAMARRELSKSSLRASATQCLGHRPMEAKWLWQRVQNSDEQRVAASMPMVGPGQGQEESGAANASPHLPVPPCLIGTHSLDLHG